MREIYNLNFKWAFRKQGEILTKMPDTWDWVNLPHSYNAIDGQNHKGLIDFKRQYKKDSFYAYKAWLSEDPFIHLAGKRYVNRAEDVTKVTVYTNQPEVELLVNGVSLGKKTAWDHFFKFDVTLAEGENVLVAKAGELTDTSKIVKVAQRDPAYIMQEKGVVLNWWDITEVEGKASLNTKLLAFTDAAAAQKMQDVMEQVIGAGKIDLIHMIQPLGNFSILRTLNLMSLMIGNLSKEQLLEINAKLNEIDL